MSTRSEAPATTYYRWTFDGEPVAATSLGWETPSTSAWVNGCAQELHFTCERSARKWLGGVAPERYYTSGFRKRFRLVKVTRRRAVR